MISGLNKDLQQTKEELKSISESYAAYKEEMSNHEQRIEEITVDKELAEAKAEELEDEMEKLKEKFEETKLELEVLKSEIEINGKEGATSTFQNKQMEKESENLKVALIKLRDLSLQDKSEINGLRKQNEEFTQKVKILSKENETLKAEKSSNLVQINELKDQVIILFGFNLKLNTFPNTFLFEFKITATMGSVEMIEQLTEQNLDLETKIEEMRETIADLEEMNDVNEQIQESARDEERELRQQLDLKENQIREVKLHFFFIIRITLFI